MMKHRTIRSTMLLPVIAVFLFMLVTVANGVEVVFVLSPSVGIAPYTATFQVAPVGETPPFQYNWSFGDGQTTNTSFTTVQHIYAEPGTFAPIVTVFDKLGLSGSATNQIEILPPYKITDYAPTEEGFVIEWALPPGQGSIVQQTTNLVETPFTDLSKVIPYPAHSYTDTVFTTKSRRFYRIVAPPE